MDDDNNTSLNLSPNRESIVDQDESFIMSKINQVGDDILKDNQNNNYITRRKKIVLPIEIKQ